MDFIKFFIPFIIHTLTGIFCITFSFLIFVGTYLPIEGLKVTTDSWLLSPLAILSLAFAGACTIRSTPYPD